MSPGTPHSGVTPPCPFKKEATVAEVPFPRSVMGNFMVYQDRLETNSLQRFLRPENSECFS